MRAVAAGTLPRARALHLKHSSRLEKLGKLQSVHFLVVGKQGARWHKRARAADCVWQK